MRGKTAAVTEIAKAASRNPRRETVAAPDSSPSVAASSSKLRLRRDRRHVPPTDHAFRIDEEARLLSLDAVLACRASVTADVGKRDVNAIAIGRGDVPPDSAVANAYDAPAAAGACEQVIVDGTQLRLRRIPLRRKECDQHRLSAQSPQ
jgi:hypothetical protein